MLPIRKIDKVVQIQLSELLNEDGYSVTLASLTSEGRIFLLSNALKHKEWVEIPNPPISL